MDLDDAWLSYKIVQTEGHIGDSRPVNIVEDNSFYIFSGKHRGYNHYKARITSMFIDSCNETEP